MPSAVVPEEEDLLPIPRRYFLNPSDVDENELKSSSSSSAAAAADYLDASALLVGMWECADQVRSTSATAAPTTEQQVAALLEHVHGGLTTLDAADHYGNSERIIQHFLRQYGADNIIEICTKFCPSPGPMTYEVVESAIQKSIDNIFPESMLEAGKVIDVLHFHWWNWSDTRYVEALIHLSTLQSKGMIKHISLTNFDAAHVRIVIASGLLVLWNQVHCSLLDNRSGGVMTRTCMSLSALQTEPCKLVVYGALAGGMLTDKWLDVQEPTQMTEESNTWMECKYKRFIDAWGGWELFQELLRVLRNIANEFNQMQEVEEEGSELEEEDVLNIANIALKWVEMLPHVSAVIVGARLGENNHIVDNQSIFTFDLSAEHLESIDRVLNRAATFPHADCGDE